jgi:serine/threonine-protein kinase RsbW
MTAVARGELEECLPARPESVAALRHEVLEFAALRGASARERENIALAVSEALSNAVVHAYAGRDEPGLLAVRASVDEGALEVEVCDEGSGISPRRDSPGMGFGLDLIARVSDRLELEDAKPGARVRMTFRIGRNEPSARYRNAKPA